jgi:hypothetical protein
MRRIATHRRWQRALVATLAGYALALQALLAAMAGGLHAGAFAPGHADALCSPANAPAGAPATPNGTGLCCILACHAPSLGAAPTADARSRALPAFALIAARPPAAFEVTVINPRPLGSRAPPILS